MELDEGISVVVPSYKGEEYISTLLNSLKEQTLDYSLFEVIFVINGQIDKTPDIIKDFQSKNPKMNIILANSENGASYARNKGISLASRQYLTFIDNDDFISPNYLKRFLEHARPNRVVIGYFLDVDEDTGKIKDCEISESLPKESGLVENVYSTLDKVLTISCNKLIPTDKKTLFNVKLNNGEDVVYFPSIAVKNDFEFYCLSKEEDAIYYRLLRSNSLSRKEPSYEFNISDRLKVINELHKLFLMAKTSNLKQFIVNLIFAQILVFMRPYVREHLDELEKIIDEIRTYDFIYFPYWYFGEDITDFNPPTKELVISYAFPPTIDTSGNVASKRILVNRRTVDVMYGSYSKNTHNDYLMANVVNEFVHDRLKLEINNSYFYLDGIKFVREGLEILNKRPTYERIYSRVQYVPTHFLAFLYKASHDTYWVAEFSDPIIYALGGELMSSSINNEEIVKDINEALPEGFDKVKLTDTTNEVAEYITFIMADEIIFTNENQMKLMVEDFPELKEMVLAKSKVERHPVLEDFYYYIRDSDYEIDDNYVNFAYFGTIYMNRSFEDFLFGFLNLNDKFNDKFRLHIFTSTDELFKQILPPELLEKTIINPPTQYFDFLNLSTKMDVLLVEDNKVDHLYDINPFSPSKISDYLGSGTDIWAVCDKGSIMDGIEDITYKSYLNDLNSSKKVIDKIMSDKLSAKVESEDFAKEDIIQYYQKRHIQLLDKVIKHEKRLNNDIENLNGSVDKLNNEKKLLENNLKDSQARIQEYKEYVAYLRKFMRPRFVFKILKKIRNYIRKLKRK